MSDRSKRVLVAEPEYYAPEALALLGKIGTVDWISNPTIKLQDICAPYQVIVVRLAHRITPEVLAQATTLEAIGTSTTGLDHIDTVGAAARAIPIISLRGETAFLERIHATPEHTIGILLALLRRLPSAVASVKRGEWAQSPYQGRELYERTVSLIGFGRVAKIVARVLNTFGAHVIAYDPHVSEAVLQKENVTPVSLDEALRTGDIVSLHPLLTPETEGMITREKLALMKQGAILVNTARGQLVDETALLDALEHGHLAGAAIDVLADESHPATMGDQPLIRYTRDHDNLLITPHIAGTTLESLQKTQIFIAQKLLTHFGLSLYGTSEKR